MSGDIKDQVTAITAAGETTLVLHGADPAGRTASRMLPALPEVCFAESPDAVEALRHAIDRNLDQLILFAAADGLTGVDDGLLGAVTVDMGGSPALAAEVAAAGSARRACELWRDAGMLGPCARELCRRVADGLESTGADGAGGAPSPVAVQVVLLDGAGERMVGMYGRLRR